MGDLAWKKKGIVLFHDIQPSTARALPVLLADLKAKGYRIVHLQPKAEATTMPEFDVVAQRELDRRRATVAAQPLAQRALTWSISGEQAQPAVAKALIRPAPRTTPRAIPRRTGSPEALRW
jgi:hypothetical protein